MPSFFFVHYQQRVWFLLCTSTVLLLFFIGYFYFFRLFNLVLYNSMKLHHWLHCYNSLLFIKFLLNCGFILVFLHPCNAITNISFFFLFNLTLASFSLKAALSSTVSKRSICATQVESEEKKNLFFFNLCRLYVEKTFFTILVYQ